ncbi:ATP-binding protein [Paenibacillus abyssi]|uniref:histidine kinase n=1 Tax=Paenibacillus abyssi TaxID=1340531 RepID=A0A917G5P8_9BACL|nr:ATP-binding protein [Paenibacillus abyssi]GGG23616.1 hypothetical protein GCM10010916_45210 [Paenibacillus abyssi]
MRDHFGTDNCLFTLLSLTISVLSSYTTFQLIGNFKQWNRSGQRYWLFGGAAVFGLGVSAVHFLIMLASDTMVIIDVKMSLLLLIGTGLSFLSFLLLRSGMHSLIRVLAASFLISVATCGLFFVSMFSVPLNGYQLHGGLVLLSFILSWACAFGAYYLFELKERSSNLICSLLLGSSMLVMQFIAIEVVAIEYTQIMTADRLSDNQTMLVAMLGIGILMVIGFSLMTAMANKRLEQVGEQYKLLVENSIDMIAICCEGQWKYVNRSGMRMFEAEQDEDLIGKSIYTFLHPNYHSVQLRRLSTLEPEISHGPVEQEWYTVKGKLLYTEVVETRTALAGKPAVQIIIRDISERKKNEELLINSEKLYVAGQLAAGIAHEIRNPLTSLKGFLQLITSGRCATKNYYDIMKSELSRIESIVSELLMLSKPQIYDLAYIDTRKTMGDTVTLLEGQAMLHNIELETQYNPSPLWVRGVENQIKQVFINVLNNAIEAMSEGGKIHIRCTREADEVVIRITDQGPGIAEEQLSKMGQPFYTTKDKGTGLGLMVSYKIADNHQGSIKAYSEIGIGTTFEITLPYAEYVPAEEESAAPKVTPISRFRGGN